MLSGAADAEPAVVGVMGWVASCIGRLRWSASVPGLEPRSGMTVTRQPSSSPATASA